MTKTTLAVLSCAGVLTTSANAQTWEPDAAAVRFELWNGVMWTSEVAATPGTTVEWRVVFDYSGTRTDLLGLGTANFQPTLSNVDNSGPIRDEVGAWRNGGLTGAGLPGTILTAAEGASGAPNPNGYGRVVYGAQGTGTSTQNIHTTFRHSGGANGAPAGDWIRLAGSFATTWPRNLTPPTTVTTDDANRILRGITIEQFPQSVRPDLHTPGVDNLVVFRQAVTIGDGDVRDITLNSFRESLRRWTLTGTDDRRFIAWQTGPEDNGSHRTGVVFQPAVIHVVPSPTALAPGVLGVLWCARRRARR